MKDKKNQSTREKEAVTAFLKFRSFPADKQIFALAFMNGMEFQRNISGERIKTL